MAMLEIKNLSKSFGKLEVLKDISFSVEKGQAVSVIGPSGSGKSTLLRCVNQLEKADGGTIDICGIPMITADENGKAVSIESLTGNINKVQSDLVLRISGELSENKNIKVKIPVGSLTDSYLLAGKGFSVPLNICSAGNVDVKLKSEFTSAGINQTCHRISAVVSTEINSSIPLYSFSSEAEFEFLIAENVLVGGVPDYRTGKF